MTTGKQKKKYSKTRTIFLESIILLNIKSKGHGHDRSCIKFQLVRLTFNFWPCIKDTQNTTNEKKM